MTGPIKAAVVLLAVLACACPGQGPAAGLDALVADRAAPPDTSPTEQGLRDLAADGQTPSHDGVAPDASWPDVAQPDAPQPDLDGDGIADALEATLAKSYFPYLSIAPKDSCPVHGVLYRLTKHPADASKIMVWYVVLFDRDCGALGHAGDDEVFGAVIDPSKPAPAGLLALRAISHQGTLCQKITTCGSLPKCTACTTATRDGVSMPVVFASVNKHGSYVSEKTCDLNFICDLGGCTLNSKPSSPPMVNAGEPGKPLVSDLTTQGFITTANGWKETKLQHFNPWSKSKFGGAGVVSDDLTDKAFVVSPSGC